jgi:hypothetical protein
MLSLFAMLFDGVGIAVAAVGIATTWGRFHPVGERFFDPITRRLARIRSATMKLLRRRQDVTAHAEVALTGAIGLDARARARVLYGPLDPANATSAIIELERRLGNTDRMVDGIYQEVDQLHEARVRSERSLSEIRRELDETVNDLKKRDSEIATDGLRLEALGLFLVGVGLVLQAAAQVLKT